MGFGELEKAIVILGVLLEYQKLVYNILCRSSKRVELSQPKTTKQNWWENYGSTGYWWYRGYARVKEKLLVPENTIRKQWVTHQDSLKKPLFASFLEQNRKLVFTLQNSEWFFNIFGVYIFFFFFFWKALATSFKTKKYWSRYLNFISSYEFLNFYAIFQNSKFFGKS